MKRGDLKLYSRVMGLLSSPSVRSMRSSNESDAKTGRICSEVEEEEGLRSEQRVSEEEEVAEAGRRIRAAMEGETGDLMRLALRIETLLVGRGV